MAKLNLTYVNLYTKVSNFLGLTSTGVAPTSTNLTLCQEIVARGLRQFLYPIDMNTGKVHEWSFINKMASFTTSSGKWKYSLPVDFSEMTSIVFFNENELLPPLKQCDAQQIKNMRSDVVSTEWPQFYAITPITYDAEIGTIYEMWVYPNPDRAYTLNFWYRFDPIMLSATTDLMVGGIRVTEAILESCLAVAEVEEEDGISQIHQKEAQRLIQIAINGDTITQAKTMGNLYCNRDNEWPPIRPYLIPYQISNIYSSGETINEFG